MKLYLIPTPIGNLEDITLRALRILKEVDVILAEDTRTSSKLLHHYEIEKRVLAHHQFNEHKTTESLVRQMLDGTTMALISDAGTPGISDPGFLLARACIQAGIAVECLPGPTAFVPALVNSGLPSDRFQFEGFLPHKKGRQTRLKELAKQPFTFLLYESPFRLVKTLDQLAEYLGADRQACVSRELTKIYEENRRGTLSELASWYTAHPPKGEIVIVVAGMASNNSEREESEREELEKETFCYEYPRPAVTADIALLKSSDVGHSVLLIERKHPPFQGTWALPGGFVNEDENLEEAALRELEEETGISSVELEQFHTYSDTDRDPRHRTITTLFIGKADNSTSAPVAGDDASKAAWFTMDGLPTLAFDHEMILKDVKTKLGL